MSQIAALPEQRYQAILAALQSEEGILVSQLATKLGVSEMTIRRDLTRMEQKGLLMRVHGGAVRSESARFGDRMRNNAPSKRKAAAKLKDALPRSGTIYLDGSTTALNLIEYMHACQDLQVATNNLEAFDRLSHVPGVEAVLLGGRLDRRTDNLVGALALRSLLAVAFDAAFFSAWGLTPELGPMEMTLEDAEVKDLVASRSQVVYLAIDQTKLGRTASGTWSPDRAKTVLATNLSPDDPQLDGFRPLMREII